MNQRELAFNKFFWSDFWRLLRPFWQSKEKWRAYGLLSLNILCLLGEVRLSVAINHFDKAFFDALQQFNRPEIIRQLWHFAIILVLFVISLTYSVYLNRLLGIKWRKWLTQVYFNKWLSNRNYYKMQFFDDALDNPDQRLSDDIEKFVLSTLSLFSLLVHSSITLGTFGFILWKLGGHLNFSIAGRSLALDHYLFYGAILYALAGTYLTSFIGKKLPILDYGQQHLDANLRYGLVRFREHSEQIAVMKGGTHENGHLLHLFYSAIANYKKVIGVQRNLTFFSHCYKTLITIYGFILSMPLFLSRTILLGGVMQIVNALKAVISAFSLFVTSFSMLAEWRATIARILDFEKSLENLNGHTTQIHISDHMGKDIVVRDLHLSVPNSEHLIKCSNVVFEKGCSVLISGPSGVGKSIFMKALAGVWPHGEGRIDMPSNQKIMFIPQKPYIPIDTLANVIYYPLSQSSHQIDLTSAIELTQMQHLYTELSTKRNWGQELSLGEQQRLSFARILFHKPDFVFLDETTSALDEQSEQLLYKTLRTYLPQTAIITIGHKKSLRNLHSHHLYFTPDAIINFSAPETDLILA